MNTYFLILILIFTYNIGYGEVSIKPNLQEVLQPRLELVRNFDPCDSEPRITLRVLTDNIISSDSLFGFDFGIKFDTTKVRYLNVSTGTSIMEKFTTTYINGNNDEQMVRGGGGILGMNPITGDGLLFGISFRYIAEDFSSTTFAIDYLIMTDEFTREIDLSNNVFKFDPVIKDIPSRRINILSSEDNFIFDSTLVHKINIVNSIYNDNRLNSFDLKVNYDKNIISLDLLSNEDYEIEILENGLNFDIYKVSSDKFVSTSENLYLKCYQNSEVKEEIISNINLEIIDWDKKSCITNQQSNFNVDFQTYKKEEETHSVEKIIEKYSNKHIEIYNILGNKIYESDSYHKGVPNLENGLYFLRSDEKIVKIIIN